MNDHIKETIIIVHGTFAGPKPGSTQWYQPARDNDCGVFVTKLDLALQKRGSLARCWAHCSDQSPIFHWTGDNSWIARASAASTLSNYVAKLRNEGWICHVIAHSHGGNVVLDALGQLTTTANMSWPRSGKIITLGTPFIDTLLSSKSQYKALSASDDTRVLSGIIWLSVVLSSAMVSLNIQPLIVDRHYYVAPNLIGIVIIVALLIFATPTLPMFRNLKTFFYQYFSFLPKPASVILRDGVKMDDVFLVVNSSFDEAWQVLHHIRNTTNPFIVKDSLGHYVGTTFWSNIKIRDRAALLLYRSFTKDLSLMAKIWLAVMYVVYCVPPLIMAYIIALSYINFYKGAEKSIAPTYLFVAICLSPPIIAAWFVRGPLSKIFGDQFYFAFLRPFRWFINRAKSVGGILSDIAVYVIRYRSWSILQRIVLGLDGYRFEMPEIETDPSAILGADVTFVHMPREAEQRALANRNVSVTGRLVEVSRLFANYSVTTTDALALLREIEENTTLVHGAYYSDDACVAEIADWIAGTRGHQSAKG